MKNLLKYCSFLFLVANVIAKPASEFLSEAYDELKKVSTDMQKPSCIDTIKSKICKISSELQGAKDVTFDKAWSSHYDASITPYIEEMGKFLLFLEDVKIYEKLFTFMKTCGIL